jgi:hypothetical protein
MSEAEGSMPRIEPGRGSGVIRGTRIAHAASPVRG